MYWAGVTDDIRQSLTHLTDALEVLVNRDKERDTTEKLPNLVLGVTVTCYYQQNNILK